MANYTFTTPRVLERGSGGHRLFQFYNRSVGVSVAKTAAGAYISLRFPNEDDVATYLEFYQGGSKHTVNDAQKAAIIAANIGVTESNFVLQ